MLLRAALALLACGAAVRAFALPAPTPRRHSRHRHLHATPTAVATASAGYAPTGSNSTIPMQLWCFSSGDSDEYREYADAWWRQQGVRRTAKLVERGTTQRFFRDFWKVSPAYAAFAAALPSGCDAARVVSRAPAVLKMPTHVVTARSEALATLLPNLPVGLVIERAPTVLGLSTEGVALRLGALVAALPPGTDLARVVAAAPSLLYTRRIEERVATLQTLFGSSSTADAAAVAARAPQLLVTDIAATVAPRLEALREELPGIDVGALISAQPSLLLRGTNATAEARKLVRKKLALLAKLLPGADPSRLVQRAPPLLHSSPATLERRLVDLRAALSDVCPTDAVFQKVVAANPSLLLRAPDRIASQAEALVELLPRAAQRIVRHSPTVLNRDVRRTIAPRLKQLRRLFGSKTSTQLELAISKAPSVLTCSVERTLAPRLSLLKKTFPSADVKKMASRAPSILTTDFHATVAPRVDALEYLLGVPRSELGRTLERAPELLTSDPSTLAAKWDALALALPDADESEICEMAIKDGRVLLCDITKSVAPKLRVWREFTDASPGDFDRAIAARPTMLSYGPASCARLAYATAASEARLPLAELCRIVRTPKRVFFDAHGDAYRDFLVGAVFTGGGGGGGLTRWGGADASVSALDTSKLEQMHGASLCAGAAAADDGPPRRIPRRRGPEIGGGSFKRLLLTPRLPAVRAILPTADVIAIAGALPGTALLDVPRLRASVARLRRLLPRANIPKLLQAEPSLLLADVPTVVAPRLAGLSDIFLRPVSCGFGDTRIDPQIVALVNKAPSLLLMETSELRARAMYLSSKADDPVALTEALLRRPQLLTAPVGAMSRLEFLSDLFLVDSEEPAPAAREGAVLTGGLLGPAIHIAALGGNVASRGACDDEDEPCSIINRLGTSEMIAVLGSSSSTFGNRNPWYDTYLVEKLHLIGGNNADNRAGFRTRSAPPAATLAELNATPLAALEDRFGDAILSEWRPEMPKADGDEVQEAIASLEETLTKFLEGELERERALRLTSGALLQSMEQLVRDGVEESDGTLRSFIDGELARERALRTINLGTQDGGGGGDVDEEAEAKVREAVRKAVRSTQRDTAAPSQFWLESYLRTESLRDLKLAAAVRSIADSGAGEAGGGGGDEDVGGEEGPAASGTGTDRDDGQARFRDWTDAGSTNPYL